MRRSRVVASVVVALWHVAEGYVGLERGHLIHVSGFSRHLSGRVPAMRPTRSWVVMRSQPAAVSSASGEEARRQGLLPMLRGAWRKRRRGLSLRKPDEARFSSSSSPGRRRRRRTRAARILALVGLTLASVAHGAASPVDGAATEGALLGWLGQSEAAKELLAPGARRDSLTLLLTTATVIPMVKALGMSPILGFLAAGVALGPQGFGAVTELSTTEALAELGVVFFLFEMGLELSIEKLSAMRKEIFGLGLAQFVLTTGAFTALLTSICGVKAALIVGGALALSSSAFVLQLLKDQDEMGTNHGRAALGVLLLQDLAVVPLLVLTPLLAQEATTAVFVAALAAAAAKAVGAVAAVEFVFKRVLDAAFDRANRARSQEAFLAVALLAALGVSAFTATIGLSDTLGAFLAGIALSETRYSRKVEADVAPFRGMLLGLFFVTVGFSMDLAQIAAAPLKVAGLALGLCAAKAGILGVAALMLKLPLASALRCGFLLSQGGEFGFVAFGLAERLGLLAPDLAKLLVTTVAVSMAATPALSAVGAVSAKAVDKRQRTLEERKKCQEQSAIAVGDDPKSPPVTKKKDFPFAKQLAAFEASKSGGDRDGVAKNNADQQQELPDVIVCGYGRLGKVVCELLDKKFHRYIVVEKKPELAEQARQDGRPVFSGDLTRADDLEAFQVAKARLVVVASTEVRAANSVVVALKRLYRETDSVVFPEIVARAADKRHKRHLIRNGVRAYLPALDDDSRLLTLPFAGAVLRGLGFRADDVDMLIEDSRRAALGGSYDGPAPPPQPKKVAKQAEPEPNKAVSTDGDATEGPKEPQQGIDDNAPPTPTSRALVLVDAPKETTPDAADSVVADDDDDDDDAKEPSTLMDLIQESDDDDPPVLAPVIRNQTDVKVPAG